MLTLGFWPKLVRDEPVTRRSARHHVERQHPMQVNSHYRPVAEDETQMKQAFETIFRPLYRADCS